MNEDIPFKEISQKVDSIIVDFNILTKEDFNL